MAYMSVVMEYDDIAYGSSGEITSRTPMTVFLDSVDDITVSESSTLTAHPVASGYEIADHMVRNPVTMDINGAFSMNGSSNILIRNDDSRVSTSNLSLKNFQKQFKRMKDEGFKCKITKIVRGTGEVRFLARDNMVLTSIQWTEKINSVSFNFNFKEAMSADIVQIPYTQEDENLPAQTQPNVMSFSSVLVDWNAITASVNAILDENGLVEKKFWEQLQSVDWTTFAFGAAASSLVITAGALAAAKVGIFAALVSNPAGWIVAGVLALGAIGVFVYKAISNAITEAKLQKNYQIQQFKYYEDDQKQLQENARYMNFIGSIHSLLTDTLNKSFYVYRIPSNEPQECYLTIGDTYYDFKFNKNNTNRTWNITVTEPMANDKILAANKSISIAKTSFDQCTSFNYLIRDAQTGAYVYLMYCPDESTESNSVDWSKPLKSYLNEEVDFYAGRLNNYCILVSTVKPEQFMTLVKETINNALLR